MIDGLRVRFDGHVGEYSEVDEVEKQEKNK
jgi:hypothetical protein